MFVDDDDEVMLNVLRYQLTYYRQAVTNAEARFNNCLRPRKPEGSLGGTAQDGHLDSHTGPELCFVCLFIFSFIVCALPSPEGVVTPGLESNEIVQASKLMNGAIWGVLCDG